MYDTTDSAKSVEFATVVVHALRGAVSPRRGVLKVIPAEGLHCGKGYDLQVGEFRNRIWSTDISFLDYEISR